MADILADRALDTLFRSARTANAWLDKPVSKVQVEALYDLVKFGPTSANCCPARFVFLMSEEAKQRLKPFLLPGNVPKVMSAPVTVIVAHDPKFYDRIPELFPHNPGAREWFSNSAPVAEATAFRNGTLQGAYLIMAARALGLDCGPMSGFSNEGVDEAFFPDGEAKSNFLCSIGYADHTATFERSPRFPFEQACMVL